MNFLKINVSLAILIAFAVSISAQLKTNFKFSFGKNEISGFIKVDPGTIYSPAAMVLISELHHKLLPVERKTL
jgi:plastocyanin domain-containing protein